MANSTFGDISIFESGAILLHLAERPIQIAWREKDWPQISSWNIPTFYIFRDGILASQWSGWPSGAGMESLLAHLHDAGVNH